MASVDISGGSIPSLTNTLTDTHIFVGDINNEPQDVALTLSATGGTFSLANTGILTMPNADATTRGLLTAADWVTFNNKQNAIPDWTTGFGSGTQATSTWTATNAAATVNAALIPKAGGAVLAALPNGAASGGNARGGYAVDFQTFRTNANEVSSGGFSVICGGRNNRSAGADAVIVGGNSNIVTNQRSFIGGGTGNNLTTLNGGVICGGESNSTSANGLIAIVGGASNTATGANNFIGGGQSNSAGTGSHIVITGGQSNTASASYSKIIGGLSAVANLYGQSSHASGQFSTGGDAQANELIWRRAVTGTAITELFLDGSSAAAILPTTNSVWHGTIEIVAICTNAGGGTTIVGDVAAASYLTTIKRIGANTALVGGVQQIGITNADASMSTASFTIDANNTNESLRIQFTAPATADATTQIRVVSTFRGTQIKY
jgi:hypothetical protein